MQSTFVNFLCRYFLSSSTLSCVVYENNYTFPDESKIPWHSNIGKAICHIQYFLYSISAVRNFTTVFCTKMNVNNL